MATRKPRFTNTIAGLRQQYAEGSRASIVNEGRRGFIVSFEYNPNVFTYGVQLLPVGTPAGHAYKTDAGRVDVCVIEQL